MDKEAVVKKRKERKKKTKVKNLSDRVAVPSQELSKHWIFCSSPLQNHSDSSKLSESPKVSPNRSFYARPPVHSPKHISVALVSPGSRNLQRATHTIQSPANKVHLSKTSPACSKLTQASRAPHQTLFSHGHWLHDTVHRSPSVPSGSHGKAADRVAFPRSCVSCQKWFPIDNHFKRWINSSKLRASCMCGAKFSKSSVPDCQASRTHARPGKTGNPKNRAKHHKERNRDMEVECALSKGMGNRVKKSIIHRTRKEHQVDSGRMLASGSDGLGEIRYSDRCCVNKVRYLPRNLYSDASLVLLQTTKQLDVNQKAADRAKKLSPLKKGMLYKRKYNNKAPCSLIHKGSIPNQHSAVTARNSTLRSSIHQPSSPRHTVLRKTSMSAKVYSCFPQLKAMDKGSDAAIAPMMKVKALHKKLAQPLGMGLVNAFTHERAQNNKKFGTNRAAIHTKSGTTAPSSLHTSGQYSKHPQSLAWHFKKRKRRERSGSIQSGVPVSVAELSSQDSNEDVSLDPVYAKSQFSIVSFQNGNTPDRSCWDKFMNASESLASYYANISSWSKQNKSLLPSLASGARERGSHRFTNERSGLQKPLTLSKKRQQSSRHQGGDGYAKKHNCEQSLGKNHSAAKQSHNSGCTVAMIPQLLSLLKCFKSMSAPLTLQTGMAQSASSALTHPADIRLALSLDPTNTEEFITGGGKSDDGGGDVSLMRKNFTETFALLSIVDTGAAFLDETRDLKGSKSSIEKDLSTQNNSPTATTSKTSADLQKLKEAGNNICVSTADRADPLSLKLKPKKKITLNPSFSLASAKSILRSGQISSQSFPQSHLCDSLKQLSHRQRKRDLLKRHSRVQSSLGENQQENTAITYGLVFVVVALQIILYYFVA